MNRYLKVAGAILLMSNSVLQAQEELEKLSGAWKRFEGFIGVTDLMDDGNMKHAVVCEDDDNYCWILTPRNSGLAKDAVDVINIYINKDPGETTGRIGVIDGADFRVAVDLKNENAVVEQYDNIDADVPLVEYAKYILRTQIPRDAWKIVIQDGYIALIIEKRWLESLSLSGPSRYYALIYSGEKAVSVGVFSSDQAMNAREDAKGK